MRKNICMILTIMLFLQSNVFLTANAGDIPNNVVNGGFEQADTSGWQAYMTANFGVSETEAHSGDYAAVVSGRTSIYQGMSQTLTLERGRTYEFSVWVKAPGSFNQFVWLADTSELKFVHLVEAAVVGGEWTKLSGEVRLDGTGAVSFSSRIQEIPLIPGTVTPVVYFDDFEARNRYTAQTIEITGSREVVKPAVGAKTTAYSARVMNQAGSTFEMNQSVTWGLESFVYGVSINAETGELTILPDAAETSVTIVAQGEDLGKTVIGTKTIRIMPYDSGAAVDHIEISGESVLLIPLVGELDYQFEAGVFNAENDSSGLSQEVSWNLLEPVDGVSIKHESGVVTVSRSAAASDITLTALSTQYQGSVIGQKTIEILTDEDKVRRAYDAIQSTTITSESLNAITQNITLPQKGAYGCDICWRTDKPDVVSENGEISRTTYNEEVTLTADIQSGLSMISKEVNLCVVGKAANTNTAEKNLISNADFEKDESHNGFEFTTRFYQSGRRSAQVTDTMFILNESISVENGVPYRYAAWVKLPEDSEEKMIVLGVICPDANGGTKSYWVKSIPAVSGAHGWVYVEGTYSRPTSADGEHTDIKMYIYANGITDFYVDNITVCKIEPWGKARLYGSGADSLYGGTRLLSRPQSSSWFCVNKLLPGKLEQVAMMTAFYDEYGQLLNIFCEEAELGGNDMGNVASNVFSPENAANMKVFLVRSLRDIKPIIPLDEILLGVRTYYVAKNGSDDNDGSIENPFLSIGRAAELMQAGDTCIIREGSYRETVVPRNSGTSESPIRYMAYPGEKVVISGADVETFSWSVDSGQIYKAETEEVKQLFVDKTAMNVARFPNATPEELLDRSALCVATEGDYDYIGANNLPELDLDHATVHIWPGDAWRTYEKKATYDRDSRRLYFNEPFAPNEGDDYHDWDPFKPKAGNAFYIYGKRSLLDTNAEWVWENGFLYVKTPTGEDPTNCIIEVKKRDWGFHIVGREYIHIQNIDFFAAAVNVRYSNHCVIDGCDVLYQGNAKNTLVFEGTDIKSMVLYGNNNVIKNSHISKTAGDGVLISGNYNTVMDCIIHDTNTYGDRFSSIRVKGTANKLLNNTLFNTGADIIYHTGSQKTVIAYNEMYNGGKLAKDLGAVYAWGTDGAGAVIAYNRIHDMGTETGVYLDSFCSNYRIHHNLIYNSGTAVVLNSDCVDTGVYNNTMYDVASSFLTFTYKGYLPSQRGSQIINNIIIGRKRIVERQGHEPLFINNLAAAIDTQTFLPQEAESVLDTGLYIEGVTNGFTGSAVDIGAFETGKEKWQAGARGIY